jgi:hypothetical protein
MLACIKEEIKTKLHPGIILKATQVLNKLPASMETEIWFLCWKGAASGPYPGLHEFNPESSTVFL